MRAAAGERFASDQPRPQWVRSQVATLHAAVESAMVLIKRQRIRLHPKSTCSKLLQSDATVATFKSMGGRNLCWEYLFRVVEARRGPAPRMKSPSTEVQSIRERVPSSWEDRNS